MSNRVSPVWHPMTQHKIFGPALHVDSAEGAVLRVRGSKGERREVIDGISSWWVNTHGHCHPKIVEAVREQAGKLEQVIFAGFTHDPAEKLTRKLLSTVRSAFDGASGKPLEFVFYSDSGSTAIEVALKMAIGYFAQTGTVRKKVIALEGGYHGDTFGTMAAGGRSVFNAMYEDYLFDVTHMPFPAEGEEQAALKKFQSYLEDYGADTAAFVFEPIVQGASGMRAYTPKTLKAMAQMCREYGVLLIADEVMTGFGRTGDMFACQKAGIVPDLLCLSKGLTGGFLPMGATLTTKDIYKAFYKDDKAQQFFHSTSFTGNPMACAAALASLEIWEEGSVEESLKMIEMAHRKAAGWFVARPDVKDVRVIGTIFALDIHDDVDGYLSSIGTEIYDFMLAHDILLRPIGNCVYILPPYCISEEQLEQIYSTLWQAMDASRAAREEMMQEAA